MKKSKDVLQIINSLEFEVESNIERRLAIMELIEKIKVICQEK